MSKVLLDLLAAPLKSVGAKLGADYIHSTGIKSPIFDLILKNLEDNTNKEINDKLDKIITGMEGVRTNLKEISTQIGSMQLGIKQDAISVYIDNINSVYDQYTVALLAMAKASLESPSPKKKLHFDAARKDLDIRIQAVENEVYNDLQHIHTYAALQETNSLFSLMNAVSLRESSDFISHFCRMKMVLLSIYAVQERGLQLLTLVAAEKAEFSGGGISIGKIWQNIIEQEQTWRQIVTDRIVELATTVLENPSKAVMVSFSYDKSHGIHSGNEYSPYYFMHDRVYQWWLEPREPVDALNFQQDRYFRLRSENDGQYMTINAGNQYRVVRGSGNDQGDWKVTCTEGGKVRLKYRYGGWIAKFQQQSSGAAMWAETSVADNDPTARFSITLYRGNLWGTQLRVSESLVPDTWIESANEKYRFWLKKDGQLGIFSLPEDNLTWDPLVQSAYVSRVFLEYNGSIKVLGSNGVEDRDHDAGLISPVLGEDYVHQYDVCRLTDEGKLEVLSKAGTALWTCDSSWDRIGQKKEPSTAKPYRADHGTPLALASSATNNIRHLFLQDDEGQILQIQYQNNTWHQPSVVCDKFGEPDQVPKEKTPLAVAKGKSLNWMRLYYLNQENEIQQLYWIKNKASWFIEPVRINKKPVKVHEDSKFSVLVLEEDPKGFLINLYAQRVDGIIQEYQLKSHSSWSESYPFSEKKGLPGTQIASNFFLKDNIRHLQLYYQRENSDVVEYIWDHRLQWLQALIINHGQPENGLASVVVHDSKKYTLRVYLIVGVSWNYQVEEWGLKLDLSWEKIARFGGTMLTSKLAVETSPGQQVRVYMQETGDGGSGGKKVTVWECLGDSGEWNQVTKLSWVAEPRNYG